MPNTSRNEQKRKIVESWLTRLTDQQKHSMIHELLEHLEEQELVRIGDLAPYWYNTGEPVVPGFEPYDRDE